MSKRSEEKAKHLAGYYTTLSTTLFNVGVFAPFFAYIFNIADFQKRTPWYYLLLTCFFVSMLAIKLFFYARKLLNDLPDK